MSNEYESSWQSGGNITPNREKRAEIAAQIMAGLIASAPVDYVRSDGVIVRWSPERTAKSAVEYTNALIKELYEN